MGLGSSSQNIRKTHGEKRAARSESGTDSTEAAASASKSPDLIDATHYDFERLERAVSELARSHDVLQAENATLREQLEEREGHSKWLEDELSSANERRRQIAERLDALIDELDRLDESFSSSTSANADDALHATLPSLGTDSPSRSSEL